ncbi:hypothetical protein [Aquella oligotrophica]|uniref:Uncharacterized protein n=1 Tax=Aquella oligotrophica TaxID=2067065 RepID=A0A2I7N3G9_9NEIS|nr:hypothetical protein [Aquella oligotrophica]AUR51004.1 hypothetical protein CUN60_01355 [Aquella oligotrophica]
MKKIIILILIISTLALMTISINKKVPKAKLATIENSESEGIAKEPELLSSIEWLKRYPQLKNVPTNSQTAVIDKLRVSESISELIGPIDNPYGVRNDILAAILEIVPESNPKMLKAAIKTAYYENLLFYSTTDSQRLNHLKQWSLASTCMSYYDNSGDIQDSLKIGSTISDLMRNQFIRKKYISNLEQTTFAWKPLGTGLGGSVEDERCQNEEY